MRKERKYGKLTDMFYEENYEWIYETLSLSLSLSLSLCFSLWENHRIYIMKEIES